MITFKPEVFAHHRRKDGSYNIKIRVTFNRQSRRIPTSLFCTSADLTRSLKLKNGDLLNKTSLLINEMRSACAGLNIFDLDGRDVDFVVDHIKSSLRTERFTLDFFEWADTFIQSKREGTRRLYVTALNALERYVGKRELDINDITYSMLVDFVAVLNNESKQHYNPTSGSFESTGKTKNGNTTSILINNLAHIFKAAKERYNDEDSGKIVIPRSPFDKIKRVSVPSNGQKNLGQELMQKIISYETEDVKMRKALDVFILSFGLMGANIADLYGATPFKGDVWVYQRQKTRTRRADHAEMRVRIPDEMRPYLERLKGHGGWWLNELHQCENKDRLSHFVNYFLKKWCEMNGEDVFTFYAARHTWASLARKAGVEKATVDEGLAHVGDYEIADIYAERDWDLINNANRKVLDLFEW